MGKQTTYSCRCLQRKRNAGCCPVAGASAILKGFVCSDQANFTSCCAPDATRVHRRRKLGPGSEVQLVPRRAVGLGVGDTGLCIDSGARK